MSSGLPFAAAEVEASLIDRWRRVVAHFPDQLAVTTTRGERYTYQAIDQTSNALAHALLAELGPINCPIILLLGHSPAMIISILGVLKANKAYVAFDPTQTVAQLQLLRETTAAPIIVTDQAHYAVAQAIATTTEQVWCMEALPTTPQTCPDPAISPDSIAGIFFTSGTINRPKGVPRSHRTILHRSWFSTNLLHFAPGHHISGIRQCGLGGGVADVFNALLNGATYCIYSLQTHGLQGLSEWLQTEKISYFHPPIILFRQWLDTLDPEAHFPHLRQILPSGRKSSADLARLWPHVPEACVVLTSYSATETTEITCTVLDRFTPAAEGVLHVGQPLPGKTVLVMHEDGQLATVDEVGEIVVRSRYISAGYWREPALTAQRFQMAADGSGEICYHTGDVGRLRPDGTVELVGRRDSQVKLRGYRVVLSEVEDALQALPTVKAAVVTADEERGLLLAYVIAATALPAPPSAIRAALAQRLPAYVLPTQIIYLSHFPLLASGKVNRQALPAPAHTRPALETPYVPAPTPLAATLVTIWEEVLGVQPVGINDHFLDLGGNSLSAMRLMVEIERTVGQKVSLVEFFNQPTIAHLAHCLRCNPEQCPDAPQNAVAALGEDSAPASQPTRPLSPAQAQALQQISAQINQPDVVQSWRQPRQVRWHRRRKAIHVALGTLPDQWRLNLLRRFVQQGWVQRRYFPQQVRAFEQFLQTIDHDHHNHGHHNHDQAIAYHLFCGCIDYYKLESGRHRISHHTPTDRASAVRISGIELVEQALAQKRGVLLLRSHVNGSFYFNNLPFKSYRVGQLEKHLPPILANDRAIESELFAHQLNTARQVLESGGIVNISADGHHGYSGSIDCAFLGRHRSFHSSFAELAVLTGAVVIAIEVDLNRVGQPTISFVGPLATGDAHEPYATRVDRLLAQYVAFCQTTWATKPWLIPWYQLAWHLAASPWEAK